MPNKKIAFIAAEAAEAEAALPGLAEAYGNADETDADVIVALGGDGFMLQAMHRFIGTGKAVYGMNRGSIGFLMNAYSKDGLLKRLDSAVQSSVYPLKVSALDMNGKSHEAIAFNEVSFLRERHQAAKLEISIDNRVRIQELICDGVIVATPAGSTAYNLSAGGPILSANLSAMVITPLCPHSLSFRPIVIKADNRLQIECVRMNEQTTLLLDGQVTHKLKMGDVINIQKHAGQFLVVNNPLRTQWDTLAGKLNWAEKPRYNTNDSSITN